MNNISNAVLEQNAVDMKELSTNYIDVAADACGCGFDTAQAQSDLINSFPLVNRLLRTRASQMVRNSFNLNRVNHTDTSKWSLKLPTMAWTEPPKATGTECCWESFDFAKCCGEVPMNLLCLKQCDSVFDDLVKNSLKMTSANALSGIANAGDTAAEVETRIAKLSFAFFQAQTFILGLDETYTDVTKPFHGLLAVMENPAVVKIACTGSILAAFDQLGCRLDMLSGDFFIAVNPIIYRAIDNAVFKGQDGDYPAGWTKSPLRFHGIEFIQDKTVPVDMTTGTGEAWLIDGNTTGLFTGFDLFNPNVRTSGIDTSTDSCGASCTYYYNYGTAFGYDANKLAIITDIPIDSACTNVMGGLEGLITPNTLIPGTDTSSDSASA